ncbi:SMI1/KNR4 family protein [Peribacillus butanolivorans]|uniref:SMI1/KNR4 family protein n=1 Tax=Peribacillus butanolivorans TaxID=421767 RepID=UPI003626473D
MPFINQTLTSFKNRLDEDLSMIISGPEGENSIIVCSFNNPATKEQIEEFEKKTEWILPEDYKAFLFIHNGCMLFEHIDEDGDNVGGGLWLHSLEEIESAYKDMQADEPDNPLPFIPIGSVLDGTLAISNKKLNAKEPNYLLNFDIPSEEFSEDEDIQLNFELFLDRYIISQGNDFWNWTTYTAENYYKL